MKVFAVPTTWLFVTMSPLESKTMPEPSPSEVWIWTTEGSTALTTPSYSCWSCSATDDDCCAFGAALRLVAAYEAPSTRSASAPTTSKLRKRDDLFMLELVSGWD